MASKCNNGVPKYELRSDSYFHKISYDLSTRSDPTDNSRIMKNIIYNGSNSPNPGSTSDIYCIDCNGEDTYKDTIQNRRDNHKSNVNFSPKERYTI